MPIPLAIHGHCDARFARVREVFASHFESGLELGGAVSVVHDGRCVVDLWAGYADAARTRPWQRDTLVNVWSTTKGITAIAAHRAADEGRLDLDAAVARYWPEFAAAGKARIPVRDLLSHRAGLPAIRKSVSRGDMLDWETMTGLLAAETPWWEPGTRHGYHALTYGWLVGEVVRRASGKRIGDYVREAICAPLGVEFQIGFGPDLDARTAELVQGPFAAGDAAPAFLRALTEEPEGVVAKTFANPPILDGIDWVNSRAWREAEIPGAGGHGSAWSLARLYGALARGGELDGVRVLRAETIDRARSEHSNGPDLVLLMPTRIGAGFFLPQPEDAAFMPNPRAFGHGGAGGSYSHADPEARFGFAYTMNLMHIGAWLVDPRAQRLLAATYASL
jgi:CubicO group peptidase (beta-lactamase class C family)